MNYKININGVEYEVNIRKVEDTKAHVTVNSVDYEVEVEGLTINPTRMIHKPAAATSKPTLSVVKPKIPPATYELKPPLPGTIIDICVAEGDTVETGQQLMILEAMKMENSIQAEQSGVVEKIFRKKGDAVLENDVILIIK